MTGTFVRPLVTSSCNNPPIARVSPLRMSTLESSVRVSIIGLATVAPAKIQVSPAIDAAVKASTRDPANVKRDGFRHPAQTLGFFGVAPEKTVIEITPGNGWTAESGELAVTTFTGELTTTDPASGQAASVPIANQTLWRRADGIGWQIVSDYNVALPSPTR